MSQPYAEGSIFGVELIKDITRLKCQIIDGAAFYSTFQGSTKNASDGTPYVQLANVGTKGLKFGVLLEFDEIAVFTAIKAAIDAALAASEPGNITLADDVHSINASCVPDFSAGQWISYPAQRMNASYVSQVTMRFEVTA